MAGALFPTSYLTSQRRECSEITNSATIQLNLGSVIRRKCSSHISVSALNTNAYGSFSSQQGLHQAAANSEHLILSHTVLLSQSHSDTRKGQIQTCICCSSNWFPWPLFSHRDCTTAHSHSCMSNHYTGRMTVMSIHVILIPDTR